MIIGLFEASPRVTAVELNMIQCECDVMCDGVDELHKVCYKLHNRLLWDGRVCGTELFSLNIRQCDCSCIKFATRN